MENEEDVVFEDSPLARHLINCGYEIELEKKSDVQIKKVQGLITSVTEKIQKLIKSAQEFLSPAFICNTYRTSCIQAIISSDLLEYEDFILVQEYFQTLDDQAFKNVYWCLLKNGVCDSLVMVIPSLLLSLLPSPWRASKALLLVPPAILVWRWRALISAPKELRKIKQLLNKTARYEFLLKKALINISDLSLVSRGYLMTQKCNYIWHLESSEILELSRRSRSNLPGLRTAVMNTAQRLALAFSGATCELRKERSLPANLDHQAFYLPNFDAEAKKALVDEQEDTIPSLRIITNMVQILHLKRSEYLRRLFLDLFVLNSTSSLNVSVSIILYEELLDCLKELEMATLFHRSYFLRETPNSKIRETKPNEKMHSSFFDLSSCCHSSSVHLQEALFNSSEIEEIVESCTDPSTLKTDKLAESMAKVSHHLQSASLCLERATILTAKMNSTAEPTPEKADPSLCAQGNSLQDDDKELAPLIDYVPQDEVFELYTHRDESKCAEKEEDVDVKPVDKQSTAIVMKELKNVLKVKAADWKEREKRVKRKHRSGARDSHRNSIASDSDSVDENMDDGLAVEFDLKVTTNERGSGSDRMAEDKMMNAATSDVLLGPGSSSLCLHEEKGWTSDGSSSSFVANLKNIGKQIHGSEAMLGNFAAEAVAKARANHSRGLPLKEEEFEFLGSEDSN